MISQYNGVPKGIQNLSQLMKMRIRMEGFIVFDHKDQFPQARTELAQWLAEGKLKKEETILKGGLKAAEAGLRDLLRGVNTGKLLVEVRDPNEAPRKL
jgi:NADPH-dependent curcumin reductase CurA